MSEVKAGFARVNITPPLGVFVGGYFLDRFGEGVLDELEANAVAVDDGENRVLFFSIDNLGGKQTVMDGFRNAITEETGLPYEAVFIASTHTHTGPDLDEPNCDKAYNDMLCRKLVSAAKIALADLKPCRVSVGKGRAPGISFVRRYRMKDGSIRTNPGVGNPEIAEALGTPDEEMRLVVLERDGGDDIVLIHFQVHPDTVGGCCYSADYPGFARRTVERALPGVKAVYFNGAQGDTNHVNTGAKGGDWKELENDFDDVARGYGHAAFMGRVIAGAVLQIYGKTTDVSASPVFFRQKTVEIPSAVPTAEELESARKIHALHTAGRDCDIPFRGMELTTVVAEAERMVKLAEGPESFPVYVTAAGFGDVAFAGIAGEPFTEVGRIIKRESPYAMTLPCCLTNGSEGYYAMRSAYDEGGYEARSSYFRPGVAELLAETAVEALKELHG